MLAGLFDLARPLVLSLDAERAHNLTVKALAAGLHPRCAAPDDPRLSRRLWDLDFPNPLGMAAGFDKNGEVPDALLALGFGFAEVGTVTPRPQSGNPVPRLFRLPADNAVINRFGFNNEGHSAVLSRLERRRRRPGVVGVNVGANKDSTDRIFDYVTGISVFAHVASYFTVNVSSPNTPGLRDLQERGALGELLKAALSARDDAAGRIGRRVPVLLKIAPDLEDAHLEEIVDEAMARGIDGMIVSNTTVSRDGLTDQRTAREAGGMSGRPLFRRSTRMLARVRRQAGPGLPLVGVGGVDSPEAAFTKIAAGADLVQMYSGLVFEGLGLVDRIKQHLLRRVAAEGLASIADAVSTNVEAWADTNP
ncbi:MAG: quinone-dependent dihydroorotate dehydrogenase [Hyphomicrobiales bacterium]